MLFVGCQVLIGARVQGHYSDMLLVLLAGAANLLALGLLMAARMRSEELAGGLLNLLTWPMIGLSGAWFSLEGAPLWVQQMAEFFPLTHIVQAARAVMTQGAGWVDIVDHLLWLLGMAVLFLLLGARWFSWHSDYR